MKSQAVFPQFPSKSSLFFPRFQSSAKREPVEFSLWRFGVVRFEQVVLSGHPTSR